VDDLEQVPQIQQKSAQSTNSSFSSQYSSLKTKVSSASNVLG
jgi:hypothetical protein